MISLKRKLFYKRGNIIIVYVMMSFIIIMLLFFISILYVQIDIQIKTIKKDLPFLLQNVAVLNCDKEAIKNFYYEFNMKNLKEDLILSLNKNYNNVELDNIYYDFDNNKFIVSLKIKIEPILNIKGINNVNIFIDEEIKFKIMEVLNK